MKDMMIYLMHVPWGWIKQRPHFVAEHLSKYFDVKVCYLHHVRKPFRGVNHEVGNITVKKVYVFPSRHLNEFLGPFQLAGIMKKSKFVWLTHPLMFRFIRKKLQPNQYLIYDCMDDVMEFPRDARNKRLAENIFVMEREICNRANIVFATSEYLKKKLTVRYGVQEKIHVVNNGIQLYEDGETEAPDLSPNITSAFESKKIKIAYLGTIAEWMDFNLITESLARLENIEYFFFGHQEVGIPRHERIHYFGPVSHESIPHIMAMTDVLVMPFILNELVMSVDPVKVYEYISSGKPSLVIRYPETEKFADYVYLYDSVDEFCDILQVLIDSKLKKVKAEQDVCLRYARNNTWALRVSDIVCQLRNLSKDLGKS
jgi:hypothetical protein